VIWLFVVIGAVLVFAIAAVAVGRVTGSLARSPRRSLFDLDEAVDFVADRLPDEVTAQVSYDDVRQVITWHLDLLAERGLSGPDDTLPEEGVLDETDMAAAVLRRAERERVDVTAEQVVVILDAEFAYLEAIGAIGPRAEG
jgi:hypothetical protein